MPTKLLNQNSENPVIPSADPPAKPEVKKFLDFRKYLSLYLSYLQGQGTSCRAFAKAAGIGSPNYLQRIISNERNLGEDIALRVVRAIGLQSSDKDYFLALVSFCQAENLDDKKTHLEKIEHILKKSDRWLEELEDIKRNWYYPVIWELASCKDMKLTPEGAVRALNYQITLKQAREAIDFLVRNNLLIPEYSHYKYASACLKTNDEVSDFLRRELHRTMARLSAEYLDLPVEEREYQGLAIAISPERLALAKKILKRCAQELHEAMQGDQEADRVYYLNLQCFPVARASLAQGPAIPGSAPEPKE